MRPDGSVVIIGAGHAGGSAAAFLRQFGWTGPILLVGEEPIIPYQRPPLSKAWLKGEATAESLSLKPADFYRQANIDLRLATRALAIDRTARRIELQNGDRLPYDHLVLALGSRSRKLPVPGADLEHVLELRTAADADRIKAALKPGCRLTIIGGGYIGLEVAASARALGLAVTVIEREARLLARVASPELSQFYERVHRAQGVEVLLGANVAALDGNANGSVAGVQLGDGRRIACDVALVGVGALANDELARAAGLDCNDGIIVDESARTSDPSIWAIGDCTRRPLQHYGRTARLESVPNALEQSKVAAGVLCGRALPAPEVPWFWSDQYGVKLQMAGLPFDVAQTVVRGDTASGRFAIFHLDAADAVRAVEAINAAAEFMGGRVLIASRKPVHARLLADANVTMKEMAS